MSSVYPYEDPSLQVDQTQTQTIDPTQSVIAPDTNPVDFNSVPLSGDSYAPPATGGATGMPYLPPAQVNSGNGTPVGPNGLPDIAAIMAAQRAAQGSVPSSQGPQIGQNFKDWVAQDVALKIPKAMSQVSVGNPPPPTTYGNDFAGSILSAEAKLPGGTNTQALVHGAQSQLGPLATAIAFGEGGAAIGSFVGPIGTVVGGLIGGLAGYWIGSQVQNEAGKDIVPTATMQALNTQYNYEAQNAPVPLAIGSLIPQFLAFKPNPTAIADTFSLLGKATVAPSIAERIALVRNASPDVQNQLFMMAYGTGQTAIQAKQSMDQGNFNPTVTAIDLLGGSLLSNPRKWMQAISPAYRAQIGQARVDILEKFSDGAVSKFNNETGIAPENLDLFREGKTVVLEGNRLLQANKFPEAIKAYTRAQEISQEVSNRQRGRGVLSVDQAPGAGMEPQVAPETQPSTPEPSQPLGKGFPAQTAQTIQEGRPLPGEDVIYNGEKAKVLHSNNYDRISIKTADGVEHQVTPQEIQRPTEPPVALAQGPVPAPVDAIPPRAASGPAGFRPGERVNYGDGIVDVVSTLDDGQIQIKMQNGDLAEVNPQDISHLEEPSPVTPLDRQGFKPDENAVLPGVDRPRTDVEAYTKRVLDAGKAAQAAPVDSDIKPIRATQARGNSRPMSMDNIQRLGAEGKKLLDVYQHNTAPTTGLDANWETLKQQMWDKTRTAWGGMTIDSHTGAPVTALEDKYAIGAPEKGGTVSIPVDAPKEDFMKAADKAKTKFAPQLEKQGYNLGIFHDANKGKIEFDPSIVVNSKHEAEAIGVYTHQDGGAYHFASGDGHFMPHLSDALTAKPMELTHYSNSPHTVLDPHFQGTGAPSAELAKTGPHFNSEDRMVSAYEKGTRPEKFFGKGTPASVEHTIKGDFKILDVGSPEWSTLKRQTIEGNGGVEDRQKLDTAVHQAGYDGYKNKGGTVKLFDKQSVAEINGVPVEHPLEGGTLQYKRAAGDTPAKKGISTVEEKGRVKVFVDGELAGVAQRGQEADRPDHWTDTKLGSRGMSTMDKSKIVSKIAEKYIADKGQRDATHAAAAKEDQGMVTRRSMADPKQLTKDLKASGYKVSKTLENPPDHGMILPNGLSINFENRYVTTHSGEYADLFGMDPGPEGEWGAGRDGSHVGAIFVSGDFAGVEKIDKKAGDTLTDWVLGLMKKDASFRSTHPRYGPPLSVRIGTGHDVVDIPVDALKENGFDFVKAAKEYGRKDPLLYRRGQTPNEIDSWPQLRQAILEQGGIGPSKDWPRDWIPGDLYRMNGKAPDLVAAETAIGRADLPPWGEADDSAMFAHLREAYANHRALGLQTHQEQQFAEHGIPQEGEQNGAQPKTTGPAEGTSEAGVSGETSISSKINQPNEVGGQEPTGTNANADITQTPNLVGGEAGNGGNAEPGTVQSPDLGAGTIYGNARNEAEPRKGYLATTPVAIRDANGRPIRDANGIIQATTPDVTPKAYAARNIEANQRGSSFTELGPQAGTSGGSTSDTVDFPQKVADQAPQFKVDPADPILSQVGHGVRVTPEMVQENLAFMNKPSNSEEPLNRTLLAIPDDPAFIPQVPSSSKTWESLTLANKVVDLIHGHANGDPNLSSIPVKITNDAGRVLLTIKGWTGRFFYDNARAFPSSLVFDQAGDSHVWTVAQAVFGDQLSVLMDARATINFHSMLKTGVFANKETGQSFDPKKFEDFTSAGIVKGFSAKGVSAENLLRASLGLPPDSQKLGDYYGGMRGEARAPVDMWRARLAFGVDNTPVTKMYDYEFGRNNFLTRLFPSTHLGPDGVSEIPFMPYHQQAAEWFGYQQHVVDSIIDIKKAALATGDADIIKMANGLKTNLVSKDLAESFRDNYGLTAGSKPPILPFHELLVAKNGRVGQVLESISREFLTKRYVKGVLGKGKQDLLDVQQKSRPEDRQYGSISKMLGWNTDVRKELADYYQKHFIDAPVAKQGTIAAAHQSFNRNVGPLASRIMEIAHTIEHPREFAQNDTAARAILGIAKDIYEPPYSREAMLANKETWPDLQQSVDGELARLLDKMHLPQGLVSNRLFYGGQDEGIASFDGARPNQLNINGRYFNYTHVVREGVANRLLAFLRSPGAKDLNPEALANLTKVGNKYKKDGNWVYARVLAHELGHAIQDRIYGNAALRYKYGGSNEEVLPAAHALLEVMTPQYMVGLVREGLGNELEALLNAHSTTLNEYVGGVKVKGGAEIKGDALPLWEAVNNLLEHQAHQWGVYHGTDDFSQATTETFRRNVYEPEIAKANARELGKIYEKALKVLDNHLAVEAETQLSGRGPNPSVDRTLLQPEETDAGITAAGKPNPAAVQSGTSGWIDPGAADQEVAKEFVIGEQVNNLRASIAGIQVRMKAPDYRPQPGDRTLVASFQNQIEDLNRQSLGPPQIRRYPVDPRFSSPGLADIQKATANVAAAIVRKEGEGDSAFASRMIEATPYKNLEHTLAIASAARDGAVVPAKDASGNPGFKIGQKFYQGSPNDHVQSWHPDFHKAIHTVLDNTKPLLNEPAVPPIGIIPVEQLSLAFADENRPPVPSTARVGAKSITTKGPGVSPFEKTLPSMSANDFNVSSHAQNTPSSKLSSGSAGNKVKAPFEAIQGTLDMSEGLLDQGLFDPEKAVETLERLEQAAADEPQSLTPVTPGGDQVPPIGEGGQDPKGRTAEEKKTDLQKQIAENSAVTLRGYLQALKDSIAIEDPTHQRIAAGINDLTAQMARTFGMDKWYKDSRLWVRDATGELQAYGKAYDKVAENVRSYVGELEANSPGANQRISEVMYAKSSEARKALLENMSPEEAALANHLHNYWKLTGDVLTRAGVIKSALENYLPLMIEPQSRTGVFTGVSKNYKGSTPHQIARQRIEAGPTKGQLKFESPEELQAYADDAELKHPNGEPWKVRTDIADIFSAHGKSVTQALTMKHAVDRLHYNSEVPIGKGRVGETARPILTNKEINDRSNPIVGENRHEYVSASTLIGPWRSALKYNRWTNSGDRVQEDYWIHKKVADAMEREASIKQMQGDNIATNVAKKITTVNTIWKQYQFLLTPMHAYSMLGNVSAHAGFNPLGTLDVFRRGDNIVNGPDNTEFLALTRAGGPAKSDLAAGGPAKLLEQIPVLGNVLKGYHEAIWNKIMYQMTYGLASKMAKEHLTAIANKDPNHVFTEGDQTDAYSFGMERAKRALGSLSNMDMSKNWNLWGSVLFLANKWTTSQMRTLGEAFSIGPLAKLGGALPLEGHTPEATAFMQARSIRMSQQLVLGGLIRLAMLGTVASTGISSLLNNGVSSNPYQNFQKDPAHTFDIYQGRDANGQDQWIKLPFYLFQREMLDWAMSAVKANQEGKPFLDVNQLGESVLTAPFMKFAGKLDPATKLSLELGTGQEMNAWMKGYSKYGIDDDPQITNINKSLQLMGIVDGGSLENRLLYAMRSLSPSLSFPTNIAKPTNDFPAVLSALGIGVGPLAVGDPKNIALGAMGTSQMGGTKFMQGPDGQAEPSWKYYNDVNHKADLGQQILAIAQTLGTGTADQETNKMQQMETLRQQAGFTSAQLVQLLMYRAGSSSGLQSIITQGLPPTAPGTPKIGAPTKIGNVTLTPQQEVAFQSVTSSKEVLAMEQAMSDPNWKTLDYSQRQSELNDLKAFANKITNEQFAIALGTKNGPILSTPQANAMLGEFGVIKRETQDLLNNSPEYTQASPPDQQIMMADRLAASQNAVWEKYYGATTAMKGASDNTLAQYVVLQSGLRDEARHLVEDLPSYKQSFDPMAQQQQLTMSLNFADNLVNQYIQGKSPKAFGSPLTQIQLTVAVKNGVVLQDAALNQLHQSYIYQEAPQNDQLALDAKYATLAHNVALEDTRLGKTTSVGHTGSFNTILNTTLAADEGYQNLVEQFFGTGGRVVLAQKQAELADLKARFRQEYNIAPGDLSKYDRMINLWYEQQNPDYKGFLYYRKEWEKYDPLGKAYTATVQSNYGFEQSNPLSIPAG